jgi:radical SAM protein with 4Fe4S-binding SPASM domain
MYSLHKSAYLIKFDKESLIYNKTDYSAFRLNKTAARFLEKLLTGEDDHNNADERYLMLLNTLLSAGLIEKKTSSESRSHIIQNKTNPHLNRVMMEITNSCNLRCKHCYVLARKRKTKLLPKDKIYELIEELENIGVWQIDLTGGEISTHPDIIDILKRLEKSHLLINLFTNLSTTNDKFIREIIRLKPKLVITSVESDLSTVHDLFRGIHGAHEKTVKNIIILKRAGVPVRVNISLSKYNYKSLGSTIKFLENELKAPYIVGDIQCTDPLTEQVLVPREKVVSSLIKYQSDIYNERKSNAYRRCLKTLPACGVAYDFCFIDHMGEVGLCPTLTKRENKKFYMGSIFKHSLYDIWKNSLVLQKYFGSQCSKINTCKHAAICKGGCRSRAYIETGDINGIDSVNCEVMKQYYVRQN